LKNLLAILALAVVGALLLSKLTHRARAADAQIDEVLDAKQREVDFGVVLHVVRMDLEQGEELVPGKPPLRILRTHRFGGVFDTLLRCWVGPTRDPVIWCVSEDQEPLVLHDASMPPAIWMQGSMGSGKSTSGVIWAALRMIKHAEHPLQGAGVTAPTDKRMEELRKSFFGPKDKSGERRGGMWPRTWFTWREGDQVCTTSTGLQIDFRTTHLQSAAAGSPIQGQNWAWTLNDELQDYFELDGDIRMRGRAAWQGRYERFITATPKDSPGYRTFRDKAATSEHWHVKKVIGPHQPFSWPSYWTEQIAEMDDREARRKIWAEDVGPERMTYHTWLRTLPDGKPGNLRPIPDLHAEDITAEILRPWGEGLTLLVGHDPGKRFDVSVLLKAYRLAGVQRHVWWIVGEVTTKSTTTEEHVVELLRVLRGDDYRCNRPDRKGAYVRQALVRADPYSDSVRTSKQPDKSVYDVFRQAGLLIKPAAYSTVQPTDGSPPRPGTVSKEGRLNMMRRLLCDPNGLRRLFVACDDRGQPAATRVVDSFERSERNEADEAEAEKGENDISHWTAAAGYALWMLEKPRVVRPAEQEEQA
jgi:hypothetical protein